MSLSTWIFLAIASGFAGFVDAMAGGGGLVQLPALLIGISDKPLPMILGTNKIPAVFGTTTATYNYFKKVKPGTGTFLLFILVGVVGYAFLKASATAKLVNWSTNVAAIISFQLTGHIWWHVGLILAVANVSGALLGTRMAIKGGSPLVRKVFLSVTFLLIAKVGYDWVVLITNN